MTRRRHALISVHDKTGVVDLARVIAGAGYRILSTGGTATTLEAAGVAVRQVSDYTDFPEVMDGRVKTLHPRIHGGLLARLDDPGHRKAMEDFGIESIDLVVVNLYPFAATAVAGGVTREEVIEQIDIGGPAMLRAAAKNHERVCVVSDPGDYAEVREALAAGEVPAELRRELAARAFARTAGYDAAIARWIAGEAGDEGFPAHFTLAGDRVRALRYGENPHQRAAAYAVAGAPQATVAGARFLGANKDLSYNNLLDLDAALALVREFHGTPACAIVKHNNPCGAALGADLAAAYRAALACDPQSAFGSILACNVEVDRLAAQQIARPGSFVEALIAPSVAGDALEVLRGARFGKNLRILVTGDLAAPDGRGREPRLRTISGGFLVQDEDAPAAPGTALDLDFVTRRRPSDDELRDLRFAWSVVKHVRSNAIVLARDRRTVGVGAGQMSRVDSVRLAVEKAGAGAAGSVLAGDGFFPFPDGLLAAAEAGVTAVIQPGGSRKDGEVIAAADETGVAMVCTGVRHFRH